MTVGPPQPTAHAGEERSRQRRQMHGSLFGFILKVVGMSLAWASQVALARQLGGEAYGIYITVIAWAMILALAGGFGLPITAARFLAFYAERQDWPHYRGYLKATLRVGSVTSLLIAGAAAVAFGAIPTMQLIARPMAIAIPIVVLLCLSGAAYSALLAAQMPLRAEGLGNVVRPLLVILLVGAAAALGAMPENTERRADIALMLTGIASAIALLAQFAGLWPTLAHRWIGPRNTADRREWFAASGAAMVTVGCMALIERLDVILLSALTSAGAAGAYSVGARLVLHISLALIPITALVGPFTSQLLARGDRITLQRVVAECALASTAVGLALSVAVVVCGPWVLTLFGTGYQLGRPLLALMITGQLALAACGPAHIVLAAAGCNRASMTIMLTAVMLDLVLCLALIPPLGVVGAAIATAISLSAYAVLLAIAVRRLVGVDTTIIGSLTFLIRWRRAA